MSARNWFRRSTWSSSDQADFERRLYRARPFSRAQYLHIQALHLAQTGEPELVQAALALLARLLAEYPDASQLASVYNQRAECHLAIGEWDAAVQAFRAVLDSERTLSTIRTGAYLRFCMLVVTRRRSELYGEVGRIVAEYENEPRPFPVQQFEWEVINALLAAERGDVRSAGMRARAALGAAEAGTSGLRYHRRLGLVEEIDAELEQRLRTLAGHAPT